MPTLINRARITLFYTSDIHGHVMPIVYGTNEEADLGLAKYATVIQQKRKINEHVIVIDNGDLIQGTPLMTHYVKEHSEQENPMIKIMNDIGADAGVIGNHEFNFGQKILLDAVHQSDYPWLSANLLDAKTGAPYFGKPYMIKTFSNGIRVAIVGVTTHYIPNWESSEHVQGIHFKDAYTTLEYWVQKIHKKESPHVFIAAYHGGFERDLVTGEPTEMLTGENQGYKMAQNIEGIDVLLTGHQHRVLTGRVGDCLVIQPGYNGETYGEIEIELKRKKASWAIENVEARVHTLKGVQADANVLQYIDDLEKSTQNWLDQPIGRIEGDMTIKNPFEVRTNKHPFIEFIQKVQMEASGVDISVTALLHNESTGFASRVTMRDIVSNYIYPNTLVVLSLTGKDIQNALEKSAMYFVLNDEGEISINPSYISPKPQHYNYDMWEGIEYTINVSNPFGERVEEIYYQGKPIEMDRSYHVVLNSYRATGGGDFEMFKNKPVVKEIQRDMVELISDYFNKYKTIQATTTKNFTIKA